MRLMVLRALDELGGVEYLKSVARENPPAFCALLGKCMPQAHTISGDPVNPVITDIRITLVRPGEKP
jgi:hypothetical protein